MTLDAWLKEVRLIASLVNTALQDTFWELCLVEEECLADYERGATPAECVRGAMLAGLVNMNVINPEKPMWRR